MEYKNGKEGKTIFLFDLDGTLTDPAQGITKSVRYALRSYGIEVDNLEELYPFIGPPLGDSFQEYYHFSPERAREAIIRYREYFAVRGLFENEVYPGIPELLEALRSRGAVLAVATSKPELFAEQILEHFGLRKYFHCVAGADMEEKRVKKADVIRYCFEKMGLAPECRGRCLMIGDRMHDVLGAAEAGIDCAGAGYGYAEAGELEKAGAVFVAENVGQLSEYLLAELETGNNGSTEKGQEKERSSGYGISSD